MLCFAVDSKDSYNNIKHKWIKEIRHHCPEAPILLVGTRTDLRTTTSGKSNLNPVHGHALAREIGAVKYVECSAATQDNLHAVFEEAVRIHIYPNKQEKAKFGRKTSCKVM